jgi:hypothetical protein
MDGWSTLGQAMGGAVSGAPAQNAFNQGALQGIQQANLLQTARKSRDENLAREAITPDVVQKAASGDPASQALVMAAAAQAGLNPEQLANAQKTQQGMNWGTQAMNLATQPNPDLNALNAMNIARDGKPVDLTKVADGTAYNAMVSPNSPQQSISPTQVGAADIMLKGAQANEAGAAAGKDSAEASRARAGIGADKAGNYELVDTPQGLMRVNKLNPADATPVTGVGGAAITRSTPNVNNATAPTTDDLAAIGATNPMTGKIDPTKAQAFMSWQAQQAASDPRMLNSSYAVQKFAALKQSAIGTPGATPPSITVPAGAQGTIFDPNSIAAQMAASHAQPSAPAVPAGIAGAMTSGTPVTGNPVSSAPVAAAPPSPVKGVSRAPNGAYLPATQKDYDNLPAGAVYIRPGETVPRKKGGG